MSVPSVVWARSCAFKGQDQLVFGTFGSTYASLDLPSEKWNLSKVQATVCINAARVDDVEFLTIGDAGQVRTSQGQVVAEMGSLCNLISRVGERTVCGGHLGEVYDALTGEILLRLPCPINKAMAVGARLVLALYSGEIAIAEFGEAGRASLVGLFPVLKNAVKDVAVEGPLVFCVGAAADIAIFDVENLCIVATRSNAHRAIVNSCATLGGGRFASVSRDRNLHIWSGVELEHSIATPHSHSVKCVSASDDGRFIATGAYDGHVSIYDREEKIWATMRPTDAGISSMTFGRGAFWASSYDGKMYDYGVRA